VEAGRDETALCHQGRVGCWRRLEDVGVWTKKDGGIREEAALGDEHPRQAAAKVEWARARGVWWERMIWV
jgi:hypothetical protein